MDVDTYQVEFLQAHNWMPWKRRMLARLRDLELEQHVLKGAKPPELANPTNPTAKELKAVEEWNKRDSKAIARIVLSLSDAEMVHVYGAETASQMWEQLTSVKEPHTPLGNLTARRALYQTADKAGFDMIKHITNLRQLREEVIIRGGTVSEEEFSTILIVSLPDSWDAFTSTFLSGNSWPKLSSQKIAEVLIKQAQSRKDFETLFNGQASK